MVIWIPDEKVMASRIREFPVAWVFPEPREIHVTREFPRLKLFPPVSRETGISREFPLCGFPLNITDFNSMVAKPFWLYGLMNGFQGKLILHPPISEIGGLREL